MIFWAVDFGRPRLVDYRPPFWDAADEVSESANSCPMLSPQITKQRQLSIQTCALKWLQVGPSIGL